MKKIILVLAIVVFAGGVGISRAQAKPGGPSVAHNPSIEVSVKPPSSEPSDQLPPDDKVDDVVVDDDKVVDDDGIVDTDGDGIPDDEDKCPTEKEIKELSTLRDAADGTVLDGCPGTPSGKVNTNTGDKMDNDSPDPGPSLDGDGDGGCSLVGNTPANPAIFVLLGLALLPLIRYRKD